MDRKAKRPHPTLRNGCPSVDLALGLGLCDVRAFRGSIDFSTKGSLILDLLAAGDVTLFREKVAALHAKESRQLTEWLETQLKNKNGAKSTTTSIEIFLTNLTVAANHTGVTIQ